MKGGSAILYLHQSGWVGWGDLARWIVCPQGAFDRNQLGCESHAYDFDPAAGK